MHRYRIVPIQCSRVVTLIENHRHTIVALLPTSSQPVAGDILIVRDASRQKPSYIMSVLPNPAQIRYRTVAEAIASATRWATAHTRTIWLTEDGRTFSVVSPSVVASSSDGEPSSVRRDFLERLIRRIEAEYLEMPGLQLTRAQAQRLWAVDHATCSLVLDVLVNRGFLLCGADDRFRRASDGGVFPG